MPNLGPDSAKHVGRLSGNTNWNAQSAIPTGVLRGSSMVEVGGIAMAKLFRGFSLGGSAAMKVVVRIDRAELCSSFGEGPQAPGEGVQWSVVPPSH